MLRTLTGWIAWTMLVCIVVQFFFAGLGSFRAPVGWAPHQAMAIVLQALSVVLLFSTMSLRLARPIVGLATAAVVLVFTMSALPAMAPALPAMAALHPVAALALAWIVWRITQFVPIRTDAEPVRDHHPARIST